MAKGEPLAVGDEVKCKRCGTWHPVYQKYPDASTADRDFLYVTCGGFDYYAGSIGATDRGGRRPT